MSLPQYIVLASTSPRRVELLLQLGVHCEAMSAHIDETPQVTETPEQYVLRLAQAKALAVAELIKQFNPAQPALQNQAILGADTTVVLGTDILGKPCDAQEAFEMLTRLSGSVHQVYTAVALWRQGQLKSMLNITYVHMANIASDDIAAYIATGEPFDKAGAYGIQGQAARWITRIEGSYSGVMGLPLYETAQLLSTC